MGRLYTAPHGKKIPTPLTNRIYMPFVRGIVKIPKKTKVSKNIERMAYISRFMVGTFFVIFGTSWYFFHVHPLQYTHGSLLDVNSYRENRLIDHMTLTLSDVLNNERDGLIVSLLEQWGAWSRSGAMPQSLRRSGVHNVYSITDSDALSIDHAMAKLKARNTLLFECLRCEYIFHLSMKSTKDHLITALVNDGDRRTASIIKQSLNRILFERALSKAENVLLELLRAGAKTQHRHSQRHPTY